MHLAHIYLHTLVSYYCYCLILFFFLLFNPGLFAVIYFSPWKILSNIVSSLSRFLNMVSVHRVDIKVMLKITTEPLPALPVSLSGFLPLFLYIYVSIKKGKLCILIQVLIMKMSMSKKSSNKFQYIFKWN